MMRQQEPLVLRNQAGFTLLEMLIVLSIACIIGPLTFLTFSHWSDEITLRHFTEDIEDMIQDAQIEAITQSQLVRIVFNNQDHYYYVSRSNEIEKSDMNRRIMIYNGVGETAITINRLGHFSQSGTFTISMGSIRYKLVMLLGQGRVYIEKVSG